MFITRSKVKIETFDIEDKKAMEALEELLSRPDIIILKRRQTKLVNTEIEEGNVSKDERVIEHVEYEECSI